MGFDTQVALEHERFIRRVLVAYIHLLGQAKKRAVLSEDGVITPYIDRGVGLRCYGLGGCEDDA